MSRNNLVDLFSGVNIVYIINLTSLQNDIFQEK